MPAWPVLKMQSMGTLLHIRWGTACVFNWPLACSGGSMRMSVACVAEENTIAGDHCIGGGGGFKVLSQRMMRVEDN